MTASLAHLDPPILLQLTHEMPNRNRPKKQDTPESVCRVFSGRHPSFKKMKKVAVPVLFGTGCAGGPNSLACAADLDGCCGGCYLFSASSTQSSSLSPRMNMRVPTNAGWNWSPKSFFLLARYHKSFLYGDHT